jgi:Membrane domain of glycerophosphoryl diester phosphodiesterase
MGPYELRPLSLGELLDRAFAVYRRNFWLFAGITAIPTCVLLPFQFLLLRARATPYPWGPASNSHFLVYVYAFFLIYWPVYAIIQSATTHAVSDVYLGRHSSVRAAYGQLVGSYWRVIGLTLNVGIRTTGWICLFVIPMSIAAGMAGYVLYGGQMGPGPQAAAFAGLVMVVAALAVLAAFVICAKYAVSIPAMLLEKISASAAIRRSIALSKGRRLQICVSALLWMVFTYAIAFVFQGPFYLGFALLKMKGPLPAWSVLTLTVSASIGGVIAGPLLMIILVLFYYDLRVRKEAFDLQQMMASLPPASPAASISPA